MEKNEQNERILSLANEVLKLSRNTLLVNLRFLDAAISRLIPLTSEKGTLMTDGKHLIYEPRHLLRCYKIEKESTARDYLHVVMHCIFQHMYVNPSVNRVYWDLACDMAVEAVITELALRSVAAAREQDQTKIYALLTNDLKQLTAEKIYQNLLQTGQSEEQVANLRSYFYADNHETWYMTPDEIAKKFGVSALSQPNSEKEEGGGMGILTEDMVEEWKNIAYRMSVDMETFSKQRGVTAGHLVQNLKAVTREKYDYTEFLKKFSVMGEIMKINEDEFDNIYYTYGLRLYEKMPLIEPLEYKEVKRIKEFVIAIDTSGSVAGDLVQKFIQKTYNILKSSESFFTKINLHIIQCDTVIQEDAKITSQAEFDEYLKNMKLHGFGGTDFRPVFSYVDDLLKKREFENLKGLIYFTDGYGAFPTKKPPYETAFVFIKDDYSDVGVPSWAIKLILQADEI